MSVIDSPVFEAAIGRTFEDEQAHGIERIQADTTPLARLIHALVVCTATVEGVFAVDHPRVERDDGSEEGAYLMVLGWIRQMADTAALLVEHPELTMDELVERDLLSETSSALYANEPEGAHMLARLWLNKWLVLRAENRAKEAGR